MAAILRHYDGLPPSAKPEMRCFVTGQLQTQHPDKGDMYMPRVRPLPRNLHSLCLLRTTGSHQHRARRRGHVVAAVFSPVAVRLICRGLHDLELPRGPGWVCRATVCSFLRAKGSDHNTPIHSCGAWPLLAVSSPLRMRVFGSFPFVVRAQLAGCLSRS